MPIEINIDQAIFDWQAKYGERMSYTELSRRTGISIATLHRLKNGEQIKPDLRKLNEICKALECEVSDLLKRVETKEYPTVEGHTYRANRAKHELAEIEQLMHEEPDYSVPDSSYPNSSDT